MADIFISYRREDSPHAAGRLYRELGEIVSRNRIFMDVDTIPPGEDFVAVLKQRVGSCTVLFAVIGPGWLDAADAAGRRRLDNPDDFVRIEIVAALSRDTPVVPILIDGTPMPSAERLPSELKPLARRQAATITHSRFTSDVARLVDKMSLNLSATELFEKAEAICRKDGPIDYELRKEWYGKGARMGERRAMWRLGDTHISLNDNAAGVAWWRKAAEKGEPRAMVELGFLYEDGRRGLPRDDRTALALYRRAAETGYPEALFCIALMHERGRGGLKKDHGEAARVMLAAIKKDSVYAMDGSWMEIEKLSPEFRVELKKLLRSEGRFFGTIDGECGTDLTDVLEKMRLDAPQSHKDHWPY